jgi:two-component system chemotaxis response regulator CheB
MATAPRRIHVLVVDDSAVVRAALTAILSREPGFSVAVAADPIIAMAKIAVARPDVIILDLEMPRMDGLTFLRRLMAEDPIPVVVCSAAVGPATEAALRSIELGAVEVVQKPQIGLRDFLVDSSIMLLDAVRAAARTRPRPRSLPLAAAPRGAPPVHKLLLKQTTDKVVAVGASTGGTEALRFLLESMSPDCPGIVIVQHMPEGFTRAFANRLNELCTIEVKEAAHGDRVIEGRALIAPGNKHTRVVRNGAHYAVEVTGGELVARHRPSVNVLFSSVARAAGANSVGLIMTGMGDDGATGLLEMREAGAATLAQDEASCVVFGMPKEAIACGAVEDVVPLHLLPGAVIQRAKAIGR